jgi:dUTPase
MFSFDRIKRDWLRRGWLAGRSSIRDSVRLLWNKSASPRMRHRPLYLLTASLEILEQRVVPSGSGVGPVDSSTPEPIPIGDVKAGATVNLTVVFSTTDPNDPTEGEPLIIRGSDGYFKVIDTYGTQQLAVKITRDGETLTAAVQGGDGDEAASILVGPAVQVQSASTTDSKSLTVKYHVNNNDGQTPFTINVYRSSEKKYDDGDQIKIATLMISGVYASTGDHEVVVSPSDQSGAQFAFTQAKAFRPDPDHKYFIVTADDDGTLNSQDAKTPPAQSFQIFLVGVVTHGLDGDNALSILDPSDFPAPYQQFVDDFAASLKSEDHYDLGIAFHWEQPSVEKLPNQTIAAGRRLSEMVQSKVGALHAEENDVIDVNFIGWSRGTVVISQALNDLNSNDSVPQLKAGFMMETLVDPHPANNQISGFSATSQNLLGSGVAGFAGSISNSLLRGSAVTAYQEFQSFAQDPRVIIPPNVQAAVDIYQNTSSTVFGIAFLDPVKLANGVVFFNNNSSILNLWGNDPSLIQNNSNATLLKDNESGPGIDHGAVMLQVYKSFIDSNQTLTKLGLKPFGSDPLVITTEPPGTITAGSPFGMVVTAKNADGSVNTTFNDSVTVTDQDGLTVGGMVTVNAVHGVATFTNLILNTAVSSDSLLASASGIEGGTSSFFAVQAAQATHLQVQSPQGAVVAGSPFSLIVNALDSHQNVATTYNGNITLTLASNPSNATLGGTITVQAVNGMATFSNVTINKLGNGYSLKATGTGLTAGTSPVFDATEQLVVTSTLPANYTIGVPFGLTVKAEDGLGHIDTSFTGQVTVAPEFAYYTIDGTTTVTAVHGVATFTGLTLHAAQSFPSLPSVNLSLTTFGLAAAVTDFISVLPAPATKLEVFPLFGGVVSDTPFTAYVQAEDPDGNIDTSYSGNVTLSLGNNPTGATLGGTLTVQADSGFITFDGLTIDKLGQGLTLIATSGNLTIGTSPAFDVTEKLVVTSQPLQGVFTDTPFQVVAQVEDGMGNVDTSFNGPVTIKDELGNPLGGTLTVQAINGVATFSDLTLHFITGPDSLPEALDISANGTADAEVFGLYVSAAPAVALAIGLPFETGSNLSSPFSLDVDAVDAQGNIDTNFNGTVTLNLGNNPSGATLGGTVSLFAQAGRADFSDLTIDKLGTGYTLQAVTDSLPLATSGLFNVAEQIVVTSLPPGTLVAGTPFDLTAEAEAGLGVLDAAYQGTVTVALSNLDGGSNDLGGTLTLQAENGVVNFSGLTVKTAGTYALIVSGTGLAGTTVIFTVAPAPATQLVITGELTAVTANGLIEVEVSAEDATGHIDTSFQGSVTLALANNPGGASLAGTLTVQAFNGRASFGDLSLNKTGTNDTLLATSSGLNPAVTKAFNVLPSNVATRLYPTSEPPVNLTAGNNFSLVVTAEDGVSNTDVTFNNPVTVSLLPYPGSGTFGGNLNGTLTVTPVNGVATFSNLSVDQIGKYSLVVSANGLPSQQTTYFIVNSASATHLAISAPGDVLSGAPFRMEVQAQDAYGNRVPTYNGTVTLTLPGNADNATLSGKQTVQLIYGQASYIGLTINNPATGLTLQATSNGSALPVATASSFNVYADQLVVTSPPPEVLGTAAPFTVVASAKNGAGNVDTAFNGPVTLGLISFDNSSSSLSGILTVNAVHGVVTFSGLSLNQPGTYAFSVVADHLSEGTSQPVTVRAVATQLVMNAALTTSMTAGAGFVLNVSAEDGQGALDTAFNGSVTINLTNSPAGSNLGGTLIVRAVNGVATFSNLTISSAGTYTITAISTGLTQATSASIHVTPVGLATHLIVLNQPPSEVNAGSGFGLVIEAVDDLGNLDSTYHGAMALGLNGDFFGTLQGTTSVTAVNGKGTFSGLTIDAPDSYTISATSDGLKSTSTAPFNINPISTQLLVLSPAANVQTNSLFSITVQAVDSFGRVNPLFNGSITVALHDSTGGVLSGVLTENALNGQATFSGLKLNQAGAGYTLQASTSGLASGISIPFEVISDQLTVTTPPANNIVAGAPFGLVVMAKNGAGNTDTAFNGSITISPESIFGDPSSILSGVRTVTATNGVATFTGLALNQAGNQTLSISGLGTFAATQSILVNPGPATHFQVLSQPPVAVTAGAGFEVTIAAEDALGNLVSDFSGNITVALANHQGNATLGGILTAAAVDGSVEFSGLTINQPGASFTLQANGGSLSAITTSAIQVTPAGFATEIAVTVQPPANIVAGSPFNLVVQAVDSFGTLDTAFNGNITISDGANFTLNGTLTVAAVNGVATFSGLSLDQAVNADILKLASAGLSDSISQTFNIRSGPATQLDVITPSPSLLRNSPFDLNAFATDAFGNVDPTFNGTVTLALGTASAGTTLAGTITVKATNGVAAFRGLTFNQTDSGVTLQATTIGLSLGASSAFDITVSQLRVTTQLPAHLSNAGGLGFKVSALNAAGGVDSSYNGTVTVTPILVDEQPLVLQPAITATAVNGVATFSSLQLDHGHYYALAVTGAGVGGMITNTLYVEPVVASTNKLVIMQQPTTGSVGVSLSPSLKVEIEDQANHVLTGETSIVTLTISSGPGALTNTSTISIAAVNGIATFNNLSLDTAGSYLLTATDGSLTVTTALPINVTVAPPGPSITLSDSTPISTGKKREVIIDGTATLISGQASLNSGTLIVSIASPKKGDEIVLPTSKKNSVHKGSKNQVFVNNVAIGTASGNATSFKVTFNSSATPALIQMLIQSFNFKSPKKTTVGTRNIQFQLSDGHGGNTTATKAIAVNP